MLREGSITILIKRKISYADRNKDANTEDRQITSTKRDWLCVNCSIGVMGRGANNMIRGLNNIISTERTVRISSLFAQSVLLFRLNDPQRLIYWVLLSTH